MTTSGNRETAKIYSFPARGRFAVGNQYDNSASPADLALPRGVVMASGSGWYHEAAIQEAMPAEPQRRN